MEFLNGFCVNWLMIIVLLAVGFGTRFVPLTLMKTKAIQAEVAVVVFAIAFTLIFKVALIVAITSYLLTVGFDAIIIQKIERIFKIKPVPTVDAEANPPAKRKPGRPRKVNKKK